MRDWNNEPLAEQTMEAFETHFRKAEEERQAETTTTAAGYHRANAVDCGTVATEASTLTMATMQETIELLRQQISLQATANSTTAARRPPTTRRPFNHTPLTAAQKAAMGYCWSHGYCYNPAHTSSTCLHKREGHQDSATHANLKGGCTDRYQPGANRYL